MAIGQQDLKRLIAYTSVSHFGLITLGIFAMTSQGQVGATFYMVNHGFATGALFLIAGFMIARRRSQQISDYGGVQKVAPVMAGLFLISGLAGLALPGLSTFVSEFLVLVGTFTRYEVAAVFATVGIILAAIYILWMYQRTMTGPVSEEVKDMPDLRPRELWAVAPLVALIIVLGVYPKPVIDLINPAVHARWPSAFDRPGPPAPGQVADEVSGRRSAGAFCDCRPQNAPAVFANRGISSSQLRTVASRDRLVGVTPPVLRSTPSRRRTSSTACSPRCCSSSARPWSGCSSRRSQPERSAAPLHLAITLGSLAGAFVLTIVVSQDKTSSPTAARAG